ncbi:hypothetical protein BMG03_04740 [Thioclava nitratireducens]|uniref:Uncharacterized protein n=1 Tax=Thioclava nitratireducens TaxID=1915078 RepID=A0ABM6IEP3_9RHOB|nr:oligosaccharide flippase family protein [Thioclava nitratireducens]AQS47183.1 hypothetical protein BMG03_04740 [Thioclava nitratireducens]
MRYINIRARYTLGTFARDAVKLSFGTALGRVIAFAALPLTARLYTPEDFSVLAAFLALVSPLGVAACLRFEVAIPLARRQKDAASLAILALFSVIIFTAITLLVTQIFSSAIASALNNQDFEKYLVLVPLSVFLVGTFSILQSWATAKRRFASIAKARVWQATIGSGVTLSLGAVGLTPIGLLLGSIFNIGAGGIGLAIAAARKDRKQFLALSANRVVKTCKSHLRYPLFSMPESLLNSASLQLPVFIIAIRGGTEGGHLALAMQILTIPMALIGQSISQVYSSRLVEERRAGNLNFLTVSIMRRLLVFGGIPLFIFGLIAPYTFEIVFGSEWIRSGEIILWMVPWITLQLVASPVSIVILAVGWQRAMLLLTTFGLILRSLFVLAALKFDYPAPESLAVASAIFYAITCTVVIHASRKNNKN